MGVHAKFAPSSGGKWINCQQYIGLQEALAKKFGEEKSGEAAEEGTIAHEKVAAILLARNPTRALRNADLSVEDRVSFEYYIDMVEEYLDELHKKGLNPQLFVEWGLKANEFLFGTADCLIIHDKGIVVIDYKHGKRVFVEADSWQPKIYGYLAINEHPEFIGMPDSTLTLAIVQPRYVGDAPRTRSVTHPIDSAFCNDIITEVEGAIAQSNLGIIGECTMGDHCTFCYCKSFCPAKKEVFVKALKVGEDLLEVGDLKYILDNEKAITAIIKNAKTIAGSGIENGSIDPEELGYGLKTSLKNTAWSHPGGEERLAPLLRRHGVSKEDVWVRKLISPSQAKGLVDDKEWLEKYTSREVKGVNLVPLAKADPSLAGATGKELAEFTEEKAVEEISEDDF